MKIIWIAAAFLSSALYAQETEYARIYAPRDIGVLLEKDATEALVEVKGAYNIYNPQDGKKITSGLLGKRFIVRETENGLKWGEEFPAIHQIYIQPRGNDASIFVNGIQYNGMLAIYGVTGTVNIVNVVDIESYVKSLLSSQFPTPLEPEVMAALAILIRTDAYYDSLKNPMSFWHTAASDDKYTGSALIVANSYASRAADTTRNLILVHSEEGRHFPFPATWTEHSAGKTARYEAIFRQDSDAPENGVETPHAALARQDSKWTYQVPKRALANVLDIPEIKSIELFVDQPSGKTYGIRIKDSSETHDLDFVTFQELVGKNHIHSSDFTVSMRDDAVHFTGYGKGHGVGLCLYSASALAQNGENALKILSKFFPDTELLNLGSDKD